MLLSVWHFNWVAATPLPSPCVRSWEWSRSSGRSRTWRWPYGPV